MISLNHLFGQLHDEIRRAERILLIAHKKPDGDTLGSSSSVLNWLIREGKTVTAFCLDAPPTTFSYIRNIGRYTNDPSVFDEQYDLVIVFDSGDLRYCGVAEFMPRLPKGYILVDIDHHITNEYFGDLNLVVTDASSTAEIVHRFYVANNIRIDERMATSLLTGLLTDTSSFSNAATTSGSMDAAADLLRHGARHHDVIRAMFHNKGVETLRIWGLLLSRLHHNRQFDVVSTYLLQNDVPAGASDVVEGISNFLNAVTGKTDTILVLRELLDGNIKGSFRSVRRDISKVAKLLGGGGHKKAAGFTVKGRIQVTEQGPRVSM